MKLYHNPVSTCSQKVRLVLAEKGLEFDSELIDLQKGEQFRPDYLAKNPNAVVPTLEDRGAVLIESTLINEYLEDAYPDLRLRPEDPVAAQRMRLVCKKIDELHPSCGVVTYAIGVRPGLLKRPTEDVERLIESIPDPVRRAARRSVVARGVAAPEFAVAYARHDEFFEQLDQALGASPWLAGEDFSLADAALTPYVLRCDHLGLDSLLIGREALGDWYARVRNRPAYEAAVAAWLPEQLVAGFRAAGAEVAEQIAAVASSRG